MNNEKLKKLQENVRIGGKGSVRRKYKGARKNSQADDKKVQATLKRLGLSPITDIQEVNLFKEDGSVIHFSNPKVQAQPQSNTFVISGKAENKKVEELWPQILAQLGHENLQKYAHLFKGPAGGAAAGAAADDDDVPELVESFEAPKPAKAEEVK